ncbi:transglycosylase SLT domain-containing protein [Nocardia gipuzkoensis]|uniref:transglycosylase SLT domain-containing protein n=1 Tax=Nocardia gipuzkoensis TaxID=2749991 RepID=UPI002457238B|nr:transglycosylase SLT domain-containing protein [Nocardia gipuzkoensis]
MPDYSAGTASVEIKPDFSGFVRKLRDELSRVTAHLAVDINPDLTGFANALDTELGRVRAELQVAIRPGSMTEFSAALQADLARVNSDLTIDIRPELDSGRASAVDAQLQQLTRPRVVSIIADLDTVSAMLVDARLEELARDRTVNIHVNQSGLSGISTNADSATRSLTRMSGIRFTALAAGITALVPVLLGAAGAAGGLLAAFGALGGVGAIGGSGIVGAFSAMKDASAGAGQAAQDNARDLDQVADAQQRVIDAQHNEMDSLQRVEDAQKSLTQARIDAKDAIDNLNLSVKNGALSERGAELAYRRAVVNLRKVQLQARQGKATGLDVEQAQLDVDTAAQNITNVRVRNDQTRREAADANAKGIEGSDQVTRAQRQVEQAAYASEQAQIQTAQAVRDLARAQEDAAKSAAAAAGGTDKFQEALAKLSPNARDFVLQMQALGPAWRELRMAVQDNLFAGLGDSVTTLARNQLPELKHGLSQIATGLNTGLRDTISSLDGLFTGLVNNGTMQSFIDGINQALTGMAPFVTGLTDAFIQLGAVVGPHLGPFFAALGESISQLAGPLGNIGGVFLDTLTTLMPTLTQLASAMAEGLAPVLPVIGRLFDAIGQALIPLVDPISEIMEILGNALTDAINVLAPHLPTIAKAFADILAAVAPLVGPLAELVGVLAGAVAQNLSALANALAPVITAFADGLKPVIPILADAFRDLAPVFAEVAGILGLALADALNEIMPVLPDLVAAFADMLIALAPLLPPLAELGAELFPVLADILVAIAPYLVELLANFTALVNFVVPILIPAIRDWKDTQVAAWEAIKGAWEGMKNGLDSLKEKFIEVVNKIKEVWKDLTEIFESGGLGGIAGKVVDKAIDLLPGRARGGLIHGEGTGTSDSILARLSDGEYVVNARATARNMPLLEAINRSGLPGFADGGAVKGNGKQPIKTGSAIVDSMAAVVGQKFPGMKLTSGVRSTNDWHGQGKAADFSNGSDSTPEMRSLAQFIATNYPNSLELIHQPFSHNIKNGKNVGDGLSVYGAKTMAEHRNHVHWAIGSAVSAPSAPSAPAPGASAATPASPEAAQDPSNYSPTGTYVGPSSVDTSRDQVPGGQQEGLPEQYSLQGIFSRARSILATGILSFFGLENSVLSSSNPYNRALTTTVDYYSNKAQEQGADPGAAPTDAGVSATPETPRDPNAPAQPEKPPAKHVYDPKAGAEQWRGTVLTVLRGTGRDAGLADRTLSQIRIESGGNPNAINNYDINAKNGVPSIGLLQVIKPTFDAHVDSRFPGGQRDPEANIAAALNYVDKRYGGAAKIWPTTAGYAEGGWVFGPGGPTSDSIPARLSAGEFVVNAAAAAANGNLLQAINAGAGLRAAALPPGFTPRGGDVSNTSTRDHSVNFYGDTHVMDVGHLMREQDRWATNQSMGALAVYG